MRVTDEPQVLGKGQATSRAIREVASRVFAENGFANAKVATIMEAVGRSPGAFYRHYPSKEALLEELFEEFRVHQKREVTWPMRAGEDPVENLRERTFAFWRVYRENWPIVTAVFQLSMTDARFARIWQSARHQGIRAMARVIRHAQDRGHCPGIEAELAASALCSMLEFTCYNWMADHGDFPDRDIDDQAAGQVLSQLVANAIGWRDPLPS